MKLVSQNKLLLSMLAELDVWCKLYVLRRQECLFYYMTCVVNKYKSSTILQVYQNWISQDFCCTKWLDLILAQSGRCICFLKRKKGLFFVESSVLWSTYYIAAQLWFDPEWRHLLRCICSTLFKHLHLELFVHVQLKWNYNFSGLAFTVIIITYPRTTMFRWTIT